VRPALNTQARRPSLRTLGLVALLITVASAANCPSRKAAVRPVPAKTSTIPDSADFVIFGMRTLLADQGVAKGELLSDTAFSYDDGTRLDLRRINLTFRTAQGVKDGILTAKTGVYNSRLSRLEARGNVVVVREDSTRLTSPQLVYDQARNQIFTDSAFVINQPNRQQYSGIGFESDPRMNNFRCLRACKGMTPVQLPRK
jgi:LPS export ABC transporter protein LptC